MASSLPGTFTPWSLAHWLVIVVTALLAMLLSRLRCRLRRDAAIARKLDIAFAILAAVAFVVINGWQLVSGEFSWNTALPLHVTDVTMLCVPIALWTSRPIPRAIVYYWGLALGTFAFAIPDLDAGPARVGFWIFWTSHALMMIAIAYELVGRGYRPGWRDFRIAAMASIAYAAVIVPFNGSTGYSYGYLGPDQPGQPALVSRFGSWPARVMPILVTGIALMALLTLPWTLLQRDADSSRRP